MLKPSHSVSCAELYCTGTQRIPRWLQQGDSLPFVGCYMSNRTIKGRSEDAPILDCQPQWSWIEWLIGQRCRHSWTQTMETDPLKFNPGYAAWKWLAQRTVDRISGLRGEKIWPWLPIRFGYRLSPPWNKWTWDTRKHIKFPPRWILDPVVDRAIRTRQRQITGNCQSTWVLYLVILCYYREVLIRLSYKLTKYLLPIDVCQVRRVTLDEYQ